MVDNILIQACKTPLPILQQILEKYQQPDGYVAKQFQQNLNNLPDYESFIRATIVTLWEVSKQNFNEFCQIWKNEIEPAVSLQL
jgi:hypothetical protein